MNIFAQELRQNKVSTIIWTVAMLAIAALYISIYPSIFSSTDAANILQNFPEAFKKTFGMTEGTLLGFPAFYTFLLTLVLLTGALQAMNLGTGITSKEVRDKTADFLLTKPISRFSILTQKLTSSALLLFLTNIGFLSGTWVLINIFVKGDIQFEIFIRTSLTLAFVQIFFLVLGFSLGAILPKIKSVIAVSLPTVFGFYITGLFDTIVGEEKIKYLTPFKFFDLNSLSSGGNYQLGTIVYLAMLILLAISISYIVFKKRDIHTI
jgi:ABC-2 type transport system permease protein